MEPTKPTEKKPELSKLAADLLAIARQFNFTDEEAEAMRADLRELKHQSK